MWVGSVSVSLSLSLSLSLSVCHMEESLSDVVAGVSVFRLSLALTSQPQHLEEEHIEGQHQLSTEDSLPPALQAAPLLATTCLQTRGQ